MAGGHGSVGLHHSDGVGGISEGSRPPGHLRDINGTANLVVEFLCSLAKVLCTKKQRKSSGLKDWRSCNAVKV